MHMWTKDEEAKVGSISSSFWCTAEKPNIRNSHKHFVGFSQLHFCLIDDKNKREDSHIWTRKYNLLGIHPILCIAASLLLQSLRCNFQASEEGSIRFFLILMHSTPFLLPIFYVIILGLNLSGHLHSMLFYIFETLLANEIGCFSILGYGVMIWSIEVMRLDVEYRKNVDKSRFFERLLFKGGS